jgi:hypothetical protein
MYVDREISREAFYLESSAAEFTGGVTAIKFFSYAPNRAAASGRGTWCVQDDSFAYLQVVHGPNPALPAKALGSDLDAVFDESSAKECCSDLQTPADLPHRELPVDVQPDDLSRGEGFKMPAVMSAAMSATRPKLHTCVS